VTLADIARKGRETRTALPSYRCSLYFTTAGDVEHLVIHAHLGHSKPEPAIPAIFINEQS
jgi:hypothetical protein